MLCREVTTIFLVDSPFFWTVGQRRNSIDNFYTLLKDIRFKVAFENQLACNDPFDGWWKRLRGVYLEIWKKGDPSIPKAPLSEGQFRVKPYRKSVDILRFYGASYRHVNDAEYISIKNCNRDLEPDEIEKNLSEFFPNFYVDMFACVCESVTKMISSQNLIADMLKLISSCHFHKDELLSLEKKPARVFVNCATGKFGVAVLVLIAKGVMLGEHQPVILYIYDSGRSATDLDVLKLNLLHTGYPLLRDVITDWEVFKSRKDVDFAIISQHCVLDHIAAPDCKMSLFYPKNYIRISYLAGVFYLLVIVFYGRVQVLVISISNDTADALKTSASSIPIKNITCLTRLEHNKALSSISKKAGVKEINVKNVIIWGELSTTRLDINHAIVKISHSEKSVREIVNDDAWLDRDLVETVRRSNSLNTFMEDAELPKDACDHIHDWVVRTPEDTWTSMGVYSDGSVYSVPDGIFFSFPVTCSDGEWKIVKGLTPNPD